MNWVMMLFMPELKHLRMQNKNKGCLKRQLFLFDAYIIPDICEKLIEF
jgi:hypothetical protein